jgi:hypothetical protein
LYDNKNYKKNDILKIFFEMNPKTSYNKEMEIPI